MTTPLGTSLTAADREAIRILAEQDWTAASMARDWPRLLALCTPDIVYMPPDHPALHGHGLLRSWVDQFPPIASFTQRVETIEGAGDLAVMTATFAVSVDAAGTLLENTGKALGWWQRDPGGHWLFKAGCWNWDRPMAAPSSV